MRLGSKLSWEKERVFEHPAIVKAVEALIDIAERNPEPGRIEIDGDRLYVNVMTFDAKSPKDQVAEKHERYIDVQYLIDGEETIGWFPLREELEPSKPYVEEDDYALYAPAGDEVPLRLAPGMFAIFFPHDIHRPGMGEKGGKIKKAVAKVRMDLLNS
ncbi:YhcH/YjgK/YiaL family protein [Cohnella faecalis]|uniref:DUF386 domain-containing protein n=1 Tax=Cohnella faecalis TaxID=2315694 RepID=A0A398CNR3_9BACL|nr:YhcH/YjgK/YiaL family protein [Cohnella faecalis]RIE03972.1 DUF386 domain-containing protein [Cohnella faecalis]